MEFAKIDILYKKDASLKEGEIRLYLPKKDEREKFFCNVEFPKELKFDRPIYGEDEIHALACAISYINGIRNNCTDPEFFWKNGDTMLITDIDP